MTASLQSSVAIFVDVQNIYYTVRQQYGCHFNYQAFWRSVTLQRRVRAAIAYAIDRGDPAQRRFQTILREIGFEVKLKPFIQRKDGSAKGDWDVGLALDAIELGAEVETVVLATGDGDFDVLALKLRRRYQTRVEVYGVPGLTAQSLIDACDEYVPIEDTLLLQRK